MRNLKVNPLLRMRDIIMVLLGVVGLVLKKHIANSISEVVYSYMGNFTVSFAVFSLINFATDGRLNRFLTALIALAIVNIFEWTDGFGFMSNVYDDLDYLANTLGILLAVIVDAISTKILLPKQHSKED